MRHNYFEGALKSLSCNKCGLLFKVKWKYYFHKDTLSMGIKYLDCNHWTELLTTSIPSNGFQDCSKGKESDLALLLLSVCFRQERNFLASTHPATALCVRVRCIICP